MAKGKYITEEKFLRIKAMLNGGAKSKQIQVWENVSEETVRRTNKADTYGDYKAYAAFNHKKKEEQIVLSDAPRIAFEHDNTELLRDIAFLLTIIVENSLPKILDCLKGERT